MNKNWLENKYRIELSRNEWNKFIKYLIDSKSHLLLRIINISFQIILNNQLNNNQTESDDLNLEINLKYELTNMNNENVKLNLNKENMIEIKDEKLDLDEFNKLDKLDKNKEVNLKNLTNSIQKIKNQSSKINGTCYFYLDDCLNEITSSTLSPNSELIAFTNENSSIYLFNLLNDFNNNKNNKRNLINAYQELIGGHSGSILKSKFTHDSKYLLSCGDDGNSCLWSLNNSYNKISKEEELNNDKEDIDIDNNEYEFLFDSKIKSTKNDQFYSSNSSIVCTYSGHLYPIWDLDIFSRLNLFSTCSKDGTARLWSFDNLYPLRVYCGHQSDVNCVQFHPNGSYLATGSSDKTVRLWSVQTSDFVRLFSGHRSRIYSISFSPDGNYLASAGEDKKIKLWDLRSGGCLKEFKGHNDIIHSLSFDNNSEILCSGGLDKCVNFWDIHQKNIIIEPNLNHSFSSSTSSSFSPPTTATTTTTTSYSNELIKSINVNFNIYSISTDIQNVFYINGAAKKLNLINKKNLNESEHMKPINNLKQQQQQQQQQQQTINKSNLLLNKQSDMTNLILNNNKSSTNLKTINNKLKLETNKKPFNRQLKLNNSNNSISTTESILSNTNTNSNLTINTRRRAAAANASNQPSTNQTNNQTTTTTTSTVSVNSNTFNFFNNNDDLYEV